MWWVQLGNLILTKLYRAQWWLVSLSNKSNRPSIRAYLVDAQIYVWHMARLARENNPEYILYINTQQIRDPWDLQKQSTFQCILITTQWSRLKKWTHKGPVTWEECEGNLFPVCLEVFLKLHISLVTGGMGDDSLITKKRSYPVERLNCIKASAFLNRILWIYPWWLVKDNEKGLNWSGPSLENHNLLRETLHPKSIFWVSNACRLWKVRFGFHEERQLRPSWIHVVYDVFQ